LVVVSGALAAGLVVVQPLCGIPAAFAESLPAPIIPVRLQNPCISTLQTLRAVASPAACIADR